MAASPVATDVLVARQPIYDPALRVVGYELLTHGQSAGTLSELGLSLVAGHAAYIPVSEALLAGGYARALPADRVVLKLPRDLALSDARVDAIEALVADGYRLALDRVVPGGAPHPMLDLAAVVGVDIDGFDAGDVAALRRGRTLLLAQDVGDYEALEACRAAGFDLLQGYFFCTPRPLAQRRVEVNVVNRVRLVGALQAADVELEAIEDVITRDIGLSYNLLRFINSAFFSLPRRVESIRDALILLGIENVRRWATLMAVADAGDKPSELVVTGLVRARMCELLARAYGSDDPDAFFTAGLLSVVDALTDTSMIELLRAIPLSEEIIRALLNHEGAKGRVLHAVIAYERGQFAELDGFAPAPLAELYLEAVAWATETSRGFTR